MFGSFLRYVARYSDISVLSDTVVYSAIPYAKIKAGYNYVSEALARFARSCIYM